VQLHDVFGRNAGGLMQVVDVLSHHARRLACAIERGQRLVAAAGPGATELVLHGEAPPPGFVARLLAGEEIRKVDRPHPGPDAAGGAKIRDAAFGRDARTGKRHDDAGLVHKRAQAVNGGRNVGRDHAMSR
jgi:hypothetical protein